MRSITIDIGELREKGRRKEKRGGAAALVVIIVTVTAAMWPAPSTAPATPATPPPAPQPAAGWQRDSEEPPEPLPAPVVTPPAPAMLAVQPLQIAFPPRNDGAVAAAQFIRVRNSGESPLAFQGATTGTPRFHASSDCPPQLARDESCAVAVVFDPAAGGNATDTMTIRSDAGNAQIRLSGAAPPLPPLELQPIDFNSQLVGVAGEPRTVRVANPRTTMLAPGSARATPPFHVLKDGCRAAPLPPGGACDVVIDFDPPAAADYKGELTIASRDGALIARASLRGSGTRPVAVKLDIEPRRLDFTALLPHAKSVVVSNPGLRAVKITGISMVPDVFEMKTDCLDKPLEPNGGTCRITVSRRVLARGAAAQIIVRYDGGEETAGVSSHGVGK